MITRENEKNNTMSFNPLTDDLTTINYLALAYCIAGFETKNGRKYPGVSKSCGALGLYGPQERAKPVTTSKGKPKLKLRIKVKAINVDTGEIKEFLGIANASSYTGETKELISYYLRKAKSSSKTKQGWRFEYGE